MLKVLIDFVRPFFVIQHEQIRKLGEERSFSSYFRLHASHQAKLVVHLLFNITNTNMLFNITNKAAACTAVLRLFLSDYSASQNF